MRRGPWVVAVAVAAGGVLVSACGSGSSSTSAPSAEGTKSADQIYSDALDAFDSQPSVHLVQMSTDSSGTTKIDAVVTGNAGRATLTDPSGAVVVIVVTGGAGYASQGGSGFQQLTGDLLAQVSSITLHQTVSCARKEHGALTKGPVSTVNGKRVIAIQDDGKAPGASPGTVYVALDGSPLPVRLVQTGPSTPGGSTACGHSPQNTTTSQTIDLDYSTGSVTITPPPVSGGSESGSSSAST